MQDNPETKIELINDKSLIEPGDNQPPIEPQENKKAIKIRNIVYIVIIVLCATGIILFLRYQDKKNAIENAKIEDRTGDYCGESLYFFYEDEEYNYYFSCVKNYYVIYDNKDYKLSEALEKEIINISLLDDKEIVYYKDKK